MVRVGWIPWENKKAAEVKIVFLRLRVDDVIGLME